MKYKNIFFDLDDTLWDFSGNSRSTFEEMYQKYELNHYFNSFDHYYTLYLSRNIKLWDLYGRNEITKAQLNEQRFSHPLLEVGVDNPTLVKEFMRDFFSVVPTRKKLMPHTKEILDYLQPKYNLYILSNGFRELQAIKMQASGIHHYFGKVILSEDICVMKPYPEIFHFALSATQSEAKNSIMIGDNFTNDIQGAKGVGMDQVYYNWEDKTNLPFSPSYTIKDLRELKNLL